MEPEVVTSMDGLVGAPLVGQFAVEDGDKLHNNLVRSQSEVGGVKVDRIVLALEGGGKRLALCRHPMESVVLADGNGGQRLNPLFHRDVPAGADKAAMDEAWHAIEQTFLNPPHYEFAGMTAGGAGGG